MVRIYLCGSVRKNSQDKKLCWGDEEKQVLKTVLGENAILVDPQRNPEREDPKAAFGLDLKHIKEADFMMVDARERRGLGIGSEMVIAKIFRKLVVAVVPRNGHYRRDKLDHFGKEIKDWRHPFLYSLTDAMVETVQKAGEWIRDFLREPKPVKDETVIEDAVRYYEGKGGTENEDHTCIQVSQEEAIAGDAWAGFRGNCQRD
jgi:hypothetical protein